MNFPILTTLIFLPLLSSLFIFISKNKKNNLGFIYISLFGSVATFLLSLFLWYSLDLSTSEFQFVEEKSWINNFIKPIIEFVCHHIDKFSCWSVKNIKTKEKYNLLDDVINIHKEYGWTLERQYSIGKNTKNEVNAKGDTTYVFKKDEEK